MTDLLIGSVAFQKKLKNETVFFDMHFIIGFNSLLKAQFLSLF